jgi:microcompartment protein CcmK/EutM
LNELLITCRSISEDAETGSNDVVAADVIGVGMGPNAKKAVDKVIEDMTARVFAAAVSVIDEQYVKDALSGTR